MQTILLESFDQNFSAKLDSFDLFHFLLSKFGRGGCFQMLC